MRKYILLFFLMLLPIHGWAHPDVKSEKKVIVAYLTSWSDVIPDPAYITHINYAFGHVNDQFNGVRIDNEERLKQIVALKKDNPHLQVLLSIGGWGSGCFSEMAADETTRKQFATDCKRVVEEFHLDGIDMDWEYPTSIVGGISASPEDTHNFTLLMKGIRNAIGKDKLLTFASVSTAEYVDFRAVDPYVDFVNIMAYDMAMPPKHHAPLFRSDRAGHITVEEAVNYHLEAGVPATKLVLGMPFYGKGDRGVIGPMDFKDLEMQTTYEVKWDDVAKVPYLINDKGEFICTFENQHSIANKSRFIKKRGLLGGMYWEYRGDNEVGTLRQTVYDELNDLR